MTADKAPDAPEEQAYPDTGHLTDIPSSHETCGADPAGEVAATHPEGMHPDVSEDGPSSHDTDPGDPVADERTGEDGPSSHDTSGVDPAGEVAATFTDAPAPEPKAERQE